MFDPGKLLEPAKVYEIECALLSTLLHSEDFGIEEVELDPELFWDPFNKRAAEALMMAKREGKPVALAGLKIENAVSGTNHERRWLNVVAQTPLANWRAYVAELRKERIAREMAYGGR